MTTPIPGARYYSIDLESDPPVIYTQKGNPRRPNSRNAVTLICDDHIRRCRTVTRWAALTRHRDALDRFLSIADGDRKSHFLDRLALDDF